MLLPKTAHKTAFGFTESDWERPRLSQTARKTACYVLQFTQGVKVEPGQKRTKRYSDTTSESDVSDVELCFPDGSATIGIHRQIERFCFTTTTYKTLTVVDNVLTFLFFATKHPLTLPHEYPTSTILSQDGRKVLLELQRQISHTSIENWEPAISQLLERNLDTGLFPNGRAREVLRTKEFIRYT
jgi:hypothetical protein